MIDVIVQRGAGDRPGDDITEPLLATLRAALERGRVELDRGEPTAPVTVEHTFLPLARLGDLTEVADAALGQVIRGKITDIEHRAIPGGAITIITLEKYDGGD